MNKRNKLELQILLNDLARHEYTRQGRARLRGDGFERLDLRNRKYLRKLILNEMDKILEI